MTRTDNDDMLMDDELLAAFSNEDAAVAEEAEETLAEATDELSGEDEWADTDDFPGQLAVDVYETADKLVVKARTAGIAKDALDVSISDNILTISGILSGGDEDNITRWHIQECYWGEFSRTIALPAQVREDDTKAELKDGVLTITFDKEKVETPKKIPVQ